MQQAQQLWGDPSRPYQEALQVREAVELAREQVAGFFGAAPRSVVFTSGATEAIATVIGAGAARADGAGAAGAARGRHQISTALEHSAVNKCLASLERGLEQGNSLERGSFDVVPSDSQGLVDPEQLLAAVREETSLVHLQLCNHEIGTCQLVGETANLLRELPSRQQKSGQQRPWLHTDAAQAASHMEVSFEQLGVDFMSVSAHKMGGPTGVGALLVRKGLRLEPLMHGGDQERARRAGMENFVAIAGFGATCELLSTELPNEIARQSELSSQIAQGLCALEGLELLGSDAHRASHISCFHIADVEPQAVVLDLDRQGFAVHSGSACSSEAGEPSPVLEALGLDGHRSLRISVGHDTTQESVAALLGAVPKVLAELRALRA